jgi:N-methylhydantoinase A/oxoprolinase/acetone carboxylase beta subunit
MNTILGIDSGGTYTDCVVVSAEGGKVLHKAKTLTTKDDLRRCLEACFAGLPADVVPGISLVCLSTTLVTNAIVEGHGCKEGLILIGSKPVGRLPTPRPVLVRGKYDIKGRLVENIDPAQVLDAVESFRHKVDAIAVSGYASVRCPEHELYVKAVVEDRLGVPVACAHELTSKLGYHDRTVTAVLNARLIPMVCELMDSVTSAMARRGVTAPLMIVRGDGTLMTDAQARNKPIETILSGPAASAIGAVHLSGRSDCFVVDIGGTTTDVANVSGGRLAIRTDGARVGGWSTRVRAAEVFTVGLGGDSRIHLDAAGCLRIGPERSVSYSLAAVRHPGLVDELEAIWSERADLRYRNTVHEAYGLVKKHDRVAYTGEESIVIEVLRYAPRTLRYLEQTVQLPGLRRTLADLIRHGVVERISLTPTDIWHVSGQYRPWDARAAELVLRITAEQWGDTSEALIEYVQRTLREQLNLSSVRAAMYVDRQASDIDAGGAADYFLNRLCFAPDSQALRASYRLLKPVVAIGAPAATWLGDASAELPFQADVPEHAEVANAIGAAVAHAVENIEVLIRQDTVTGQYLVFSPLGRVARSTLEQATAHALETGADFLSRLAGDRGYQLESQVRDVEITSLSQDRRVFVERVVTLSARLSNEPANLY